MKEIAAGLATLGRGPDTMLVHMAPEEVAGLQQLALAHGGSLTTNPHTGLPEAGFLKNILPTVLGAGLSMLAPGIGTAIGSTLGLSGAAGTGLLLGGLQALRTGDLGKGLMAGLGGFGGATLGGMMGGLGGAAGSTAAQGATAAGSRAADVASQFSPVELARLQAAGFPTSAEAINAANLAAGDMTAGGVGALTQPPAPVIEAGRDAGLMDKARLFARDNKLATAALGLGALGAMGGFDQTQLGVGELEPASTARLSGRWREEIDPTAMGRTDRLIYTGDRYRGSFAEGGSTHSVPMLEDGGFVLTKKAVDGLGGQQAAKEGLGAIPIKGPGTGTSDSIPTRIDGVRPALVSNGEAYIPKREVKRRGGAKKFYALMRAAERNAARA